MLVPTNNIVFSSGVPCNPYNGHIFQDIRLDLTSGNPAQIEGFAPMHGESVTKMVVRKEILALMGIVVF
jgi:hypothetical protein